MNLKQLKKKIENIDPNISVLISSDTNQPIEVFTIGYADLDSRIAPLSDGSLSEDGQSKWSEVLKDLEQSLKDK